MKAYSAWKKLFTKKHFKEHFFEKLLKTTAIGMDRISQKKFQEDLENNIDIILRKANNRTYRFTRYKQILFLKDSNKPPRSVSIPTVRDRLTLSVLNEIITNVYNGECVTQMPHVIINSITTQTNQYSHFIKLDVSSFYSSVNQDLLLKQLKRKIRKPEILDLIKKAIQTPSIQCPVTKKSGYEPNLNGIPEGLSVSNSLANIYLIDIDKKYSENKNIRYWRYVDDILIFTDENLHEIIKQEIISDLDLLGLKTNEKTEISEIKNGFTYLGYRISPYGISVRKSSVFKLEQSLELLLRKLNDNNIKYIQWKLNLKITGFVINKNKYGWMFFFSQIDDMNLLFHLDDLIKKYIKRYKAENKIVPKRFVRTYFDIRQSLHNLKYIPDFDKYSIEDKRNLLADIFNKKDIVNRSDTDIENIFNKTIASEIKDIEKDVQSIS